MSQQSRDDLPRTITSASRLSLGLFAVYVLLYAGFMTLVLVRPDLLASRPLGGVNLAITCGLGLILTAVLLAVVSVVVRSDR
jgi:uncharacterized membrane protein (DUF485 family)